MDIVSKHSWAPAPARRWAWMASSLVSHKGRPWRWSCACGPHASDGSWFWARYQMSCWVSWVFHPEKVHQGTRGLNGASFTQILMDVFESLQLLQNLFLHSPQVHKLEIAAETLSGSENFGAKGRVFGAMLWSAVDCSSRQRPFLVQFGKSLRSSDTSVGEVRCAPGAPQKGAQRGVLQGAEHRKYRRTDIISFYHRTLRTLIMSSHSHDMHRSKTWKLQRTMEKRTWRLLRWEEFVALAQASSCAGPYGQSTLGLSPKSAWHPNMAAYASAYKPRFKWWWQTGT